MDNNVLYVTTGGGVVTPINGRQEWAVTLMQPTDKTHCGGLPTFRPSGKYWRRLASKAGYNNMLTLWSSKLRNRWLDVPRVGGCKSITKPRQLLSTAISVLYRVKPAAPLLNLSPTGATFLLSLTGYVSNTRLRAVKLACGVKIRRQFYWPLITWLCGTKAKKAPKSDAVGISSYPVYAQANLQSLHYGRKQQNVHAERMSMLTDNTRMYEWISNVEESSRTRRCKTVN
ncbi:uncharacterized protein BO96DRAFT_345480 [Aspergillus niger CBS 101883]|uniref:uncharacterized protein n=1 Tax=Aspergillus lacticoffeatus (strain CBS 101883) TaxID=1450533 RepID=UPI000D7ED516|nr:uncharacterized protein BO96DRAFT_345480 [Aspergillus niger CBS 101883]PYH53353.1 hypothetical protein BO96DRAFT_345480 [Aspergillus niger CBS 101883]